MLKDLKFLIKSRLLKGLIALFTLTLMACNDNGPAKISPPGTKDPNPPSNKPTPNQLALDLAGAQSLILLSGFSALDDLTGQVFKGGEKTNPRNCVSGPTADRQDRTLLLTYTWRCYPKDAGTSGAEGDLVLTYQFKTADDAQAGPSKARPEKIEAVVSSDFAFYFLARDKQLIRWPLALTGKWSPNDKNQVAAEIQLKFDRIRDPVKSSALFHSWTLNLKGVYEAPASTGMRPFTAQVLQLDYKSESAAKTFELAQLDLTPREAVQFRACAMPLADFNFYFQSSALSLETRGALISDDLRVRVTQGPTLEWGRCGANQFTYVNEFTRGLYELTKRIRVKMLSK
ncbi:MAG: hypothetical protein IT288_04815 [Bdellovibrionales bacterium]|nr:hypothetical protein [Bdellovibrionales bacterium]